MPLALRGLKGKTFDPYLAAWRKRVVPALGHLPVRMVTTGAVDRAVYGWIADQCSRSTFGPPSHVATITLFDSTQFSGNGATDCGDGPFACPSGLTFSRFTTAPAVAADASGVHVVWNGELASGQSKVFVRNSPDGTTCWAQMAGRGRFRIW